MAADRPELDVLVECDTGAERCGVQSPEAALALARLIDGLPRPAFRRADDLSAEGPDRGHAGLA